MCCSGVVKYIHRTVTAQLNLALVSVVVVQIPVSVVVNIISLLSIKMVWKVRSVRDKDWFHVRAEIFRDSSGSEKVKYRHRGIGVALKIVLRNQVFGKNLVSGKGVNLPALRCNSATVEKVRYIRGIVV